MKPKKPLLAFFLSFILPGAGLAYLGRWKWAFINLGIVLLLGILLASLLSDEALAAYGRYIGYGCSGGSGAYAQALATQMNQQAQAQTPTPPAA